MEHDSEQICTAKLFRRVGEQQEEQVALRMAAAHLPELVTHRHQKIGDPLVFALTVGGIPAAQ